MALIGVSICDLKNVSAKVDKLVGKERNGEDKSKFYSKYGYRYPLTNNSVVAA